MSWFHNNFSSDNLINFAPLIKEIASLFQVLLQQKVCLLFSFKRSTTALRFFVERLLQSSYKKGIGSKKLSKYLH